MSSIAYLYDPLFLEHTLHGHPEHAGRLSAIMARLQHENALADATQLACIPATDAQLTEVHQYDYVSQVFSISGFGGGHMGPDTYLTDASYDAAVLAAGACAMAADAVMRGEVQRAIAFVRPPGHHAFADHGEGFCLFNNVAFAARAAQKHADCERVMIVDFDVHHGNGTQAIFYDDPSVLYISSHQMPLYPGTGRINEMGRGKGLGCTINVPLLPGAGDHAFAQVLDEVIAPAARRYRPQLILVSAGFDAHWRDPLAQTSVSLAGFARMMRGLCELSEELCAGKLVTVLEGGYDLDALSYGVLNTLRVMQDKDEINDPLGASTERETDIRKVIRAVREAHGL